MKIKLSFNLKILIATGALLLLLVALIFKAILIRQRELDRLQNLNRQVAGEMEEMAGMGAGGASDIPAVPPDAPSQPQPATTPETREEGEIDRAIAGIDDALDGFTDYTPAKRAAAESLLFERFESLIRRISALERDGKSSAILRKVEAVFQKMERLGYPYHFQPTPGRDAFIARLSSEWGKLPYVSRWAYIRMLGIVGGEKVRAALRAAMVEGVFEDEAAIALLRAGDAESLPVIIDYAARGRIKGDRFKEIKMIVRHTDTPGVMDGLIAFLDRPDPTMRSAALLLIDDFAANSRAAPRETRPDDPQLKEKWVKWWRGAQGAYRPLDEEEPRIISLTLITGLDALPRGGRFERSRFMLLTNEIVDCCRGLRSPELPVHRSGELSLYRLARIMAEEYDAADANARQVLDQYLAAFSAEVQKICMRQRFPESAERTAFNRWAEGRMEKAKLPVAIFLIRLAGVCGDSGTATALLRYAQSWVPEMRRSAVISMGLIGAPEVADEIGKMLAAKDIGWEEGERMVFALERIGDVKAVETLVAVLHKAKSVLAYQAYVSLRRFRGDSPIPISLEEFEQRRDELGADYDLWLRAFKEKKRREGR